MAKVRPSLLPAGGFLRVFQDEIEHLHILQVQGASS